MISLRPTSVLASRYLIPKTLPFWEDPDFSERHLSIKRDVYSTNGQTTENPSRELRGVAARSGWQVVGVYEDAGISGAKGVSAPN